MAYGTVELQHTSPARSGRVFVPIVRCEGIGAFAEAPAMTDTTPEVVRTFRWPVRGWSSLTKEEINSPHFDVGGVSWRVKLYPQGDHRGAPAGTFRCTSQRWILRGRCM